MKLPLKELVKTLVNEDKNDPSELISTHCVVACFKKCLKIHQPNLSYKSCNYDFTYFSAALQIVDLDFLQLDGYLCLSKIKQLPVQGAGSGPPLIFGTW